MGCYIDLLASPSSAEAAASILRVARRMGYCRLYSPGGFEGFEEIAVVRGASRRDVARALSSVPRGIPVLVEPASVDAARYASVNKRVLGIIVRPGLERLVDRSTKRLFDERGWGMVVFPLSTLYTSPYSARAWRFTSVFLRRAFAYGIDVGFASEAVDELALWHPMHVAGVAETVGVPGEVALSWLSSAPARNLEAMLGG